MSPNFYKHKRAFAQKRAPCGRKESPLDRFEEFDRFDRFDGFDGFDRFDRFDKLTASKLTASKLTASKLTASQLEIKTFGLCLIIASEE